MSKALIAFTALLGLFSFNLFAQDDGLAICKQKADYDESANIRFPSASSCPSTGVLDRCEVKARPTSTCVQDQFGVWVGMNYYYTGCLAGGGTCGGSEDPDPEPDPDPPSAIKLPESSFVPFQPSSDASTASNNGGSAISDFSQKMSVAVNTLALNQTFLRTEAQENKHQILDVMGQYNDRSFNRDEGIRDRLITVEELFRSTFGTEEISFDEQFAENKELHQKTQEAQTLAQQSLDILPKLSFSAEALLSYSQTILDSSGQASNNASEAFYAAQNAEQAAYDNYNLLSDMKEDVTESRNTIRKNTTTLSSIQSATSQLYGLDSTINSNTRSAVQDAAVSTQNTVWDSNRQIMDYMGSLNQSQATALSEIKSAIETSGGGPQDPDIDLTETNKKIDTTNYELSELKKILDTRTQTANNALSGIGSQLQNLNGSATAQGQQLAKISGTLDGIGESLDGLKDGFEGAPMTEVDFRPEEGILSALGITGEESLDDLTLDPVRLADYRPQYKEFLSGTCPENIPIQFSLLGKSYSFNLFYKPVCDFMEIAGTILNFAVWFGVPFIVFGSRRVS